MTAANRKPLIQTGYEATMPMAALHVSEPVPDAVPAPMLPDWDARKSAMFQTEILRFHHGLNATGLFTDGALADLLDVHPTNLLDVCTMGQDDPRFPNKMRTGDFRDCSGADLIAAARAGQIWINMRKAMNVHADYRAALERMYGELAARTGNSAFNAKGGILISSPIAKVPYHFDKTETILWHVRGQKRVWLYPETEQFIADRDYEAVLLNPLNDDLPYDVSMDRHATVIDLEPGEALTWPMNSPHRVDNRSFCVSVTTEYSTRATGLKNAAMTTNATLRARLGLNPSYRRDGVIARRVKAAFGQIIKRTPLLPDHTTQDFVTFAVDPDVDGYIRDVEPVLRDF